MFPFLEYGTIEDDETINETTFLSAKQPLVTSTLALKK